MPDETTGPSPDEMGLTPQETRPSEIDEKAAFRQFIENKYEGREDDEVRVINEEKFFSVENNRTNDFQTRIYYGRYYDQGGKLNFRPTASAFNWGKYMLVLSKEGRPGWRTKAGFELSEEEQLEFRKLRDDDYELSYYMNNIKGESKGEKGRDSHLRVKYNSDGDLLDFGAVHRDVPSVFRVNVLEALDAKEQFKGINLEGLERIAREGKAVDMERGYRLGLNFDQQTDGFEVTMFDRDGKPEYKVIIPKKVDIDHIVAETGVESLIEDPYQPANGIPGKSVGDADWRYKSFSDLTGIRITPIDTEESIPGPK